MTTFHEQGFGGRLQPGGRQMLRKADLQALAERGENWALEELHQIRQAERVKSHRAYEQFKARRTPEELRLKWRDDKRAQRATAAAARRQAEEPRRRAEELAAKDTTLGGTA